MILVISVVIFYIVSTNLRDQIVSSLSTFTCSSAPSLYVSSSSYCYKLKENGWRYIKVYEGFCNSMYEDLIIGHNPCLQSMYVERQALQNLKSFTLTDNKILSTFNTQDGYNGAFFWTNSLIISCKTKIRL